MVQPYNANNLKDALSDEYEGIADSSAGIAEGLRKDLEPINQDVTAATGSIATIQSTLSTLVPQVAAATAAIAGITAALALLKTAVAKAQAAADKAQATADSKPGGEGSGGYTINLKWVSASPNITGPFKVSITSQGRSISKTITTQESASLSGLSSGSVVTFGVDIGTDNTVQWKDTTQENPNLSGRSNFYKEYSGFQVPATTGTKTITADIG